jgi:hypothetical protein
LARRRGRRQLENQNRGERVHCGISRS